MYFPEPKNIKYKRICTDQSFINDDSHDKRNAQVICLEGEEEGSPRSVGFPSKKMGVGCRLRKRANYQEVPQKEDGIQQLHNNLQKKAQLKIENLPSIVQRKMKESIEALTITQNMLKFQPVSYYGSANQTNDLFFPFSPPTSYYPLNSGFNFGISESLSNFFYNPFYPAATNFFSRSYNPSEREKVCPEYIEKQMEIQIQVTLEKANIVKKRERKSLKKTQKLLQDNIVNNPSKNKQDSQSQREKSLEKQKLTSKIKLISSNFRKRSKIAKNDYKTEKESYLKQIHYDLARYRYQSPQIAANIVNLQQICENKAKLCNDKRAVIQEKPLFTEEKDLQILRATLKESLRNRRFAAIQ